jgi:hypothetical protein
VQLPGRDMEINRGLFQIMVAEQELNGSQVRTGFQQMSGEAVTQGVIVLLMICTPRKSAIAITRCSA